MSKFKKSNRIKAYLNWDLNCNFFVSDILNISCLSTITKDKRVKQWLVNVTFLHSFWVKQKKSISLLHQLS